MIVIIQNFLERPAIDHGLIALEARTLFSFKRFDGNRTFVQQQQPFSNI